MRAYKWLFLGLWILIVACCIGVPIGNHLLYSRQSFEKARWRTGDTRQRARMVGDLLASEVLQGKSRAEVSALLGPPDREGQSVWEYDYIYGNLLDYTLGLPFSGWRYTMRIEFDEAVNLVRAVDTRD